MKRQARWAPALATLTPEYTVSLAPGVSALQAEAMRARFEGVLLEVHLHTSEAEVSGSVIRFVLDINRQVDDGIDEEIEARELLGRQALAFRTVIVAKRISLLMRLYNAMRLEFPGLIWGSPASQRRAH